MKQSVPADKATANAGNMPRTGNWVRQQRQLHGDAWVTECVRRGMAGEPGWFYAMENGWVAGTPFTDAGSINMEDWHQFALLMGTVSAAFLRTPPPKAAP